MSTINIYNRGWIELTQKTFHRYLWTFKRYPWAPQNILFYGSYPIKTAGVTIDAIVNNNGEKCPIKF